VIILGLAWWGWQKWRAHRLANAPMSIEVAYTPEVAGVVKAPAGLPADLPLETTDVLESITTNFPAQNAVQSSFTYRSAASLEEKYSLYLSYLEKNGFEVTQTSTTSIRILEGTKEKTKFSITLTPWNELTVVQIAYLVF
jgi:hypothetical protein